MDSRHFNPHTLCRVWLNADGSRTVYTAISIHTPFAGCDIDMVCKWILALISIHTPFAGCDASGMIWKRVGYHFNPHTLCRVWPVHEYYKRAPISYFNPHTLCRVWQGVFARKIRLHNFNPHTLCRVWPHPARRIIISTRFQSTHPLQGVTVLLSSFGMHTRISIHTPFAGCDVIKGSKQDNWIISIHTPFAGCDL